MLLQVVFQQHKAPGFGCMHLDHSFPILLAEVSLPSDFHSVKGHFQRTSKNAIVAFTLDFIIDV